MAEKKPDPKLAKIAEKKGKSPKKIDQKALKAYKGKGAKLAHQAALEQAFGADLSKVRVHADAQAQSLCDQMNAQAFTAGSNIFFKNAGDAKNKEMLAHELNHVVQANGKLRQ